MFSSSCVLVIKPMSLKLLYPVSQITEDTSLKVQACMLTMNFKTFKVAFSLFSFFVFTMNYVENGTVSTAKKPTVQLHLTYHTKFSAKNQGKTLSAISPIVQQQKPQHVKIFPQSDVKQYRKKVNEKYTK